MIPRTLRLVVVPVLATLVLAACGSTEPAPAASVAGSDITDAQLAKEASLFTFLAALNTQQCGGPPPEGQTQEAVCNRFALSNLVQEAVVQDYADANEITVTDKQVQDIVANLDSQLGKEKVDAELTEQQLTRDDLSSLARKVLLFQEVQTQIVESELTDEQLRARYDEEILRFTTVQAQHILVETQAQAQDVFRQVSAPGFSDKEFQALATDISKDPGAKENGGSLGSAVASTYPPEFGAAVVALEPGEISKPVQTEFGWHVIELITKQLTPFAEAKTQILQSESPTVFNEWLRARIDEGNLEINPKYGRFDTETLAVVPVESTDPSATAETPAASGSPSVGSAPGTATPTPTP